MCMGAFQLCTHTRVDYMHNVVVLNFSLTCLFNMFMNEDTHK
jgi:hypothetical protein